MTGFVSPLVEAGFKVVAFDMPGHGYSGRQATDLLVFGHALEHVCSVHGKAYGLVAHSYGATATLLSLARSAQLPEKVALIAPMRSLKDHIDIFDEVLTLHERVRSDLVGKLEVQLGLSLADTDIVKAVAGQTPGGLIVHYREDRFIQYESGQAVAAAWKDATLYTTQGLGHTRLLRSQSVITEITRYLSA